MSISKTTFDTDGEQQRQYFDSVHAGKQQRPGGSVLIQRVKEIIIIIKSPGYSMFNELLCIYLHFLIMTKSYLLAFLEFMT